MTGWRCGYICTNGNCAALDNIRNNIPKLARVRISSNLPVQKAAVAALRGPQDHIPMMVNKLRKRRDLVIKRLNQNKWNNVQASQRGFLCVPQNWDFKQVERRSTICSGLVEQNWCTGSSRLGVRINIWLWALQNRLSSR